VSALRSLGNSKPSAKSRRVASRFRVGARTPVSPGFVDSDGDLNIDYSAHALDGAIDKELEKQLGTRANIAQSFDDATLKVWTVATLDEARKAVDALRS